MPDAALGLVYTEVLELLERALMRCDDAEIGGAATPHLDLALNLLQAEYRASQVLIPARD